MASEVSYTPGEVAEILKISKFTVYELIKRGDLQAYHVGRKVRVEATGSGDLQTQNERMRPAGPESMPAASAPLAESVIVCGQDPILEILVRQLEREMPGTKCLRAYMGSMNGLLALYHGQVNAATSHLWDGETGEYNTPYIRRFFQGRGS